MCPPRRLYYLHTGRVWWIIRVCGSVDVCQRITREKSSGVSPSQRRMGAGTGHARPLPVSVGILRATACLAKRDSKTGRDRKGGIESERRVNASLWRKDVPGYRQNTAESQLTKKASMTHGWRLDVCSNVKTQVSTLWVLTIQIAWWPFRIIEQRIESFLYMSNTWLLFSLLLSKDTN